MDDLDAKIKDTFMTKKDVPYSYIEKVNEALEKAKYDDSKDLYNIKKCVAMFIACIIAFSGIAYAINNVKISGRPAIDWFKVNFSDEYENYREEVQGEIIQAPSESSIELVSTVCDEGFVILEFNLKLSKEDKKYLKIGEPILTEEYINSTDDKDSNIILSYDFDYENGVAIPYTRKEMYIDEYSGKKIEDKIIVGYNYKTVYYEDDVRSQRMSHWYAIIDGEYISAKFKPQSIEQISEYEYKLYQMYFLTDEELRGKTEFTLTMKDWVIGTVETQPNDVDTCLELDGQFDIKLSKEKALENSKIIELNCDEIYPKEDLIQEIESVVVTPLQTIIKVHSIYTNVNNDNLYNIGARGYKVLSENGEKINSFRFETKRVITYENGKEEEWSPGQYDHAGISFKNATLEMIDYVLLENNEENSKIKIITQEGEEIKGMMEYTDIGSFEIDLTKEQIN